MIELTITVNQDKIDGNIEDFENRIKKAGEGAVRETTAEYVEAVSEVITQEPHGDVMWPHNYPQGHYYILYKDYDHPFARRHGAIRDHDHIPEWGVHTVTGEMMDLFRHALGDITKDGYWEFGAMIGWVDFGYDDHVRDVIKGNSLMLGRDVLGKTAGKIGLKQKFHMNVVEHLEGEGVKVIG